MDGRKLNRIWDQSVRDGDEFNRAFSFPTLEQWRALAGGERVLDAGCGNGPWPGIASPRPAPCAW